MSDETQKDETILVVDDETDIADGMAAALEMAGFKTQKAYSAKEAQELLRTEGADLVLLDIIMPEMNGLQLLEKLQEDRRTRSIPVVILSSLGDRDTVLNALGSGAVDYLEKPVSVKELRRRIDTHLQLRRWRLKAVEEFGEELREKMLHIYRIY